MEKIDSLLFKLLQSRDKRGKLPNSNSKSSTGLLPRLATRTQNRKLEKTGYENTDAKNVRESFSKLNPAVPWKN